MRYLRPRRSDQEWLELIEQCRQSGLSDRAWCLEHGIPANTFYYHVKQLREKACSIPDSIPKNVPQTQEIVPIDIQSLSLCGQDIPDLTGNSFADDVAVIVDYHGITLKVVNSASGSAIYQTLKALQELC